jgi:hypothetical protein
MRGLDANERDALAQAGSGNTWNRQDGGEGTRLWQGTQSLVARGCVVMSRGPDGVMECRVTSLGEIARRVDAALRRTS